MMNAIMPRIRLKRPTPPRAPIQDRANAARIWEAARLTEKDDNYCVPTPAGFEVRFSGRVQQITGDIAVRARAAAAQIGVDAEDWILYCYSLNQ